MLSLEEYVFDDCESSSTQGCQSKLEVWATGPTCKAPKTQINKHIGIAIADHTGSLSCQEFSSRLHVLYFPLSVSIEVNLGLGLDTKEQRFYFSIEDPFFCHCFYFNFFSGTYPDFQNDVTIFTALSIQTLFLIALAKII